MNAVVGGGTCQTWQIDAVAAAAFLSGNFSFWIIRNHYLFVFNSCVILGKPWVLTGSLADSINYTQNSHKNLAIEVMKMLMQIISEMYRARKNGLQNMISTTQAGLGRLV